MAVNISETKATTSKTAFQNEEGYLNTGKYINFNGIKQFLQIKGKKDPKEVLLVLHGGPGGAIPYISYYYQKPLEKDYLVIQWDQRGCGRTYYENKKNASELVTFKQLLQDLDSIVDHIINEYNVKKIVIIGHSWGSILGSVYVKEHPEKVLCYIGVSQIKQMKYGEILSAKRAIASAEKKGDKSFIDKLNGLIRKAENARSLEDMDVKEYLTIRAMNNKYLKNKNAVSGLGMMKIGMRSPDFTLRDMKWFFLSGFRLNKFVSIERKIMEYCIFDFDLDNNGNTYSVPIYYIFGKEDIITPYSAIEDYYEGLDAPIKKMYIICKAGHPVFIDAPKDFCNTVTEILQNFSKSPKMIKR